MNPDVAFGVELRRLPDTLHADGFGHDLLQEASGVEELEGSTGAAFG